MKIIEGDLILLTQQGHFDLIVHGCNCFNNFGAGIAKQIKFVWPEVFRTDLRTVKGDPAKLGTYTKTTIDIQNKPVTVINAYIQYRYSTKSVQVDYEELRMVLESVSEEYHGYRIGLPLLGGGLGGGDHELLVDIFEEVFKDMDVTLVLFDPTRISPILLNRITN